MAGEFGPQTRSYWERVQQREGFKRALKRQQEEATAQGVS